MLMIAVLPVMLMNRIEENIDLASMIAPVVPHKGVPVLGVGNAPAVPQRALPPSIDNAAIVALEGGVAGRPTAELSPVSWVELM